MRSLKWTMLMMAVVTQQGKIVAEHPSTSPVMPDLSDPCNVGGDIYNQCNSEVSTDYEMKTCMEKTDTYSDRAGVPCCSVADPEVQYVVCETPKPDKKALYIAATVGPFATMVSCIAAVCCWKNRNKLKLFLTVRDFHQYQAQQQINVTTSLLSDSQHITAVFNSENTKGTQPQPTQLNQQIQLLM